MSSITATPRAAAPRATISPVTVLVAGLIVTCLLAGRTLLGGGPVSGGGLLAAPPSLGAAWQAYLTGSAPWLGFSAAASLLGLGSPGWFAFLALVLGPVLAGLSALALLRRLRVPVAIDDIPEDAEPGRIQEMLEHFTDGDFAGLSVLIARGRSGAPFSTPEDRRWANTLRQTLADSEGCQLRGFYLATPAHIRQLVLGAAGRMPASA